MESTERNKLKDKINLYLDLILNTPLKSNDKISKLNKEVKNILHV